MFIGQCEQNGSSNYLDMILKNQSNAAIIILVANIMCC